MKEKIHITRYEEIPDFYLYIDQVVGIIEKSLSFVKISEDDKIITNTMINNYVKSGIVSPPVKKKYTKEHVAYFIVICLLKKVYSLEEITKLIQIQFNHSPTPVAYNQFCVLFENLLTKEDYNYKRDDKFKELFYKTIKSVVYCITVQKEIYKIKSEVE